MTTGILSIECTVVTLHWLWLLSLNSKIYYETTILTCFSFIKILISLHCDVIKLIHFLFSFSNFLLLPLIPSHPSTYLLQSFSVFTAQLSYCSPLDSPIPILRSSVHLLSGFIAHNHVISTLSIHFRIVVNISVWERTCNIFPLSLYHFANF